MHHRAGDEPPEEEGLAPGKGARFLLPRQSCSLPCRPPRTAPKCPLPRSSQAKALFPTNASESSVGPARRRGGSAANSLAEPSASACNAQSRAPASDGARRGLQPRPVRSRGSENAPRWASDTLNHACLKYTLLFRNRQCWGS